MHTEFLKSVFAQNRQEDFLVWGGRGFPYEWLLKALSRWEARLAEEQLEEGAVVSVEGDFSPQSVALLLALVERNCIIVPLSDSVESKKPEFRDIAEVEIVVHISSDDKATVARQQRQADHELINRLRDSGSPGLVLFSSGSTGKSKAAVHDMVPLLEKFKVRRKPWRAISFLLFDHIGGLNTLLYSLANGGCIVTVQDRSPQSVCEAIEKHRVELLPTSPTFINLLLVSEAYKAFDLSSLGVVTYGTEVMPESTLRRFHERFPGVRLQQTYGLSELGIMRSKSLASDSLWVKVGGEGFETRVVEGKLEIRAESAMLGYLNAPSPFTEDGWFRTGDAVEVDGDFVRFLGRESEIINVGGEKVYPAEVESVLQSIPGVEEAVVVGEPHPITGQIITARVKISSNEALPEFRRRLRTYCKDKLARYKVPQKVVLVDEPAHGGRFKKMRGGARDGNAGVS